VFAVGAARLARLSLECFFILECECKPSIPLDFELVHIVQDVLSELHGAAGHDDAGHGSNVQIDVLLTLAIVVWW
jgi:hypothetical protein